MVLGHSADICHCGVNATMCGARYLHIGKQLSHRGPKGRRRLNQRIALKCQLAVAQEAHPNMTLGVAPSQILESYKHTPHMKHKDT